MEPGPILPPPNPSPESSQSAEQIFTSKEVLQKLVELNPRSNLSETTSAEKEEKAARVLKDILGLTDNKPEFSLHDTANLEALSKSDIPTDLALRAGAKVAAVTLNTQDKETYLQRAGILKELNAMKSDIADSSTNTTNYQALSGIVVLSRIAKMNEEFYEDPTFNADLIKVLPQLTVSDLDDFSKDQFVGAALKEIVSNLQTYSASERVEEYQTLENNLRHEQGKIQEQSDLQQIDKLRQEISQQTEPVQKKAEETVKPTSEINKAATPESAPDANRPVGIGYPFALEFVDDAKKDGWNPDIFTANMAMRVNSRSIYPYEAERLLKLFLKDHPEQEREAVYLLKLNDKITTIVTERTEIQNEVGVVERERQEEENKHPVKKAISNFFTKVRKKAL